MPQELSKVQRSYKERRGEEREKTEGQRTQNFRHTSQDKYTSLGIKAILQLPVQVHPWFINT
jgi:hypothetical protein